MEKDKLIHAVSWSVLYLIGYGILTVIGNFLFSDEILIVLRPSQLDLQLT